MKTLRAILTSVSAAMFAVGISAQTSQTPTTSVRLYGLVDAGVQYITNADANGRSKTSLDSGQWTASRWGMNVKEDLGSGTYLDAVLENRFGIDTGASAAMFGGFSQVSLGGDFGKFTAGRQTSISVDKIAYYDPAGAYTYGIYNLRAIPFQNLRINNSIKYESPTLSGFNASAQYGFGQELPGFRDAGTYVGAALEHKASNWTTRAYYEQTRGTVTGLVNDSAKKDRRFSVGTRYKDEKFDVFVGFTRVLGDLQLTPNGTVYWASTGYTVSPTVKVYLIAGQYQISNDRGRTSLVSVSGQYLLSKRTSLYAALGQVKNAEATNFGLQVPLDAGAPGVRQSGVTAGIMHVF